ncbi:MAG: aconitate hydratase AcnA [Nannocystales bacterium]
MSNNDNSFGARSTLAVGDKSYEIFRLDVLSKAGIGHVDKLPFSLRVLLENLLRNEDGNAVSKSDIEAVAGWDAAAEPSVEIAFHPARVVLQDFTGVPAVVDLAAMRDAMVALGGSADQINPEQPVDLVIDHSVQVDHYASENAFDLNVKLEYLRNRERYQFLRWGAESFENFRAVPPGTGIVHQVNLEYLARTVWTKEKDGVTQAYPDSLVGTDSHTTMINGLSVLGWGVGGIEAEAAMLGQAISMLVPQVVGFKLNGKLPEGANATDMVLTVTQMLRAHGVVGKFVEFYGPGLDYLSLPDRATIANMSPEYGATCGFFPIDDEVLAYLRFTNRPEESVQLVEAYAKEQGLFRTKDTPDPVFTTSMELDLGTVVPSIAGPKRPQDRIELTKSQAAWRALVEKQVAEADRGKTVPVTHKGETFEFGDGNVVVAAITSCTNTSNPSVMVAAGLVARKAHALGLKTKPWVKTSLAPGSRVVTDYLERAKLMDDLEALGFNTVGYGCTTCIGNSGPLDAPIVEAIDKGDFIATSVLSGNRNFEGRIGPNIRANYLASPPLVVAYALKGHLDWDPYSEPVGQGADGKDVFMKDIWPTPQEVSELVRECLGKDQFAEQYASVFEGDESWRKLDTPKGQSYTWEGDSTYIRNPPYFEGMGKEPEALADISGARCLAKLGDTVTTDHISPAGAIPKDGPAGKYLQAHGVKVGDFNSFGSRRGNHEVMIRGTFANIRLRNELAPGTEGGWTRHQPSGEEMSIFDAAERYRAEGVPLVVLGGVEYGTGSSRDWAAKGTILLGVKAVITKSFERIHRSNLIGMGVLPLCFKDGEGVEELGLTGGEVFETSGIAGGLKPGQMVRVVATAKDGTTTRFECVARVDTPNEVEYYRHGGILQYVLRSKMGRG